MDERDRLLHVGHRAREVLNPDAYQHFGAKFTTDVDVSYTFMRIFTLTLGANNIFNTYPDKIAQSPINPVYVMSG